MISVFVIIVFKHRIGYNGMMGFRMFAQGRIQNFVPEAEGVPRDTSI